jgi:hypothetical protein
LSQLHTFATNGEKFDATTSLAATKSHVNVELAEKNKSEIKTTEGTKVVGPIKTEQTAVSKIVVNTWACNIEYESPSKLKRMNFRLIIKIQTPKRSGSLKYPQPRLPISISKEQHVLGQNLFYWMKSRPQDPKTSCLRRRRCGRRGREGN